MKQPYSTFDLPQRHLESRGHYIPSRARDPEEIDRRRSLPTGTVLAEYQTTGIDRAARILERAGEGADRAFASRVLGLAALNTSWYAYARDAAVMRRRIQLPGVASIIESVDGERSVGGELFTQAIATLSLAHATSDASVRTATERHIPPTEKRFHRADIRLGQAVGDSALLLALLADGQPRLAGNSFDIQAAVRDRALEATEAARTSHHELGAHPSPAQLSDPDSPLAVYWRRHAPDGAYQALESVL